MAYVDVVDPFLDSPKPGRSADVKQMRDNIRYLKTQADAQALRSNMGSGSIQDDFMGVPASTTFLPHWVVDTAGDTVDIQAEHQLRCVTVGNAVTDYAGVHANALYISIGKAEEYVAVMDVRVKRNGTVAGNYFFGWQDIGLAGGALFSDLTDCVGVACDLLGNFYTGVTALAGATSTVSPFGTPANWERIRLQFTCSATAGSRKVEFYLNDALQGTIATDANLPTARLIPVLGCRGNTVGAASREIRFDYAIFTTLARPLAA